MVKSKSADAADGAARTEPQWKPAPPDAVARWLKGKTLEELEAVEQQGRALYPDTIKRYNTAKKGQIEEISVLLRVPTTTEQVRSRVGALDQAKKLCRLDKRPTLAEAEGLLGASYFDNLDTIQLLSLCILDAEPLDGAHPRYMLPEDLDRMHPRGALLEIYERLNHYTALEDPRLGEVTEEQFHHVVAAIARCGNLSPLLVIGGSGRDSFIVSMASRLASSQTPPSG
jgi:hypothetical protein